MKWRDEKLMCKKKEYRLISCKCGAWEEMSVDEQRHHSQHFEWIDNWEDEGIYKCYNCGELSISKVKDNIIELIEDLVHEITGDEPLDGDGTEHLTKVFQYFLDSYNGNLSKEEDEKERKRLKI